MMRNLLVTAVALLAPLGAFPSAAAQEDGASLARADSLVAAWVESGRIPGAVLLVVRDGKPVLERAYGYARLLEYAEGEYGASQAGDPRPGALARLATPIPMTPATVFDLASVTKVVATTFAVMLLADRGELDVDAPAWRYLSDFRGGGKDDITLRHLLTHTSGLRQWVPTFYHASDADAAYAYVRDLPLGWAVGDGRHYSDLGFMLLGRVVEQVAHKPLDAFLREELYGPLGLRDTGFRRPGAPPADPGRIASTSHGNPYEHRMVHDTTFGYLIRGDPHAWAGWRRYTLVGEVNDGNAWHGWGGVAGHAGLFSTARDLSVLLQLLLDRGEQGGRRYLRPETVEAFLTPVVDGQALGWQVPGYAPPGSFSHTGFTGTWVLGVPSRRLTVVLLTNRQNLGLDERGLYPDVGALQRGVAQALTAAHPRGGPSGGQDLREAWRVSHKLYRNCTEAPSVDRKALRPPIPPLSHGGQDMARIAITRPDGSPSPYFWTDKEPGEKRLKTVYKQTADGVKRMKGVRFDTERSKIRTD